MTDTLVWKEAYPNMRNEQYFFARTPYGRYSAWFLSKEFLKEGAEDVAHWDHPAYGWDYSGGIPPQLARKRCDAHSIEEVQQICQEHWTKFLQEQALQELAAIAQELDMGY